MNINNFGCKIVAVGHAQESDYRFKRISEEESINNLSENGKIKLFGRSNPTQQEISNWVNKAFKQTGNTSRLVFNDDLETLGSLAGIDCFKKSGLEPKDVDFIFTVSNTNIQGYPSLADRIMDKLKETYPEHSQALCLFGQEACSVGIMAIMLGVSLIMSGLRRCVLIIAAEKATKLANPDIWLDSNLFGDGAGAILLQPTSPDKNDFLFFGGQTNPYNGEKDLITESENNYFNQDGPAVYKRVGTYITDGLIKSLAQAGIKPETIDHLLPHQASGKTVNFYGENLKRKIPTFRGKIHRDENIGNTSSASTLLLMSKLLERGEISLTDLIVCHAFGAGMTEISCGIQKK